MKVMRAKGQRGRTLLLDDAGQPIDVKLALRDATSAPEGTRIKARLLVTDEDGDTVALPFAVPQVLITDAGPVRREIPAYTPEFRLEQN